MLQSLTENREAVVASVLQQVFADTFAEHAASVLVLYGLLPVPHVLFLLRLYALRLLRPVKKPEQKLAERCLQHLLKTDLPLFFPSNSRG